MTHPLAHVPRVLNPENQCSECALVFLPTQLDDDGLCVSCVETAAYTYAADFFGALRDENLENAKFCVEEVARLRPQHAKLLESLVLALSARLPPPAAALTLLGDYAAQHRPFVPTVEWYARAFFAGLSLGEHDAAAGYLAHVGVLLPEHAQALEPLIPPICAGESGVMDHPSIHILLELSARFGTPGT